MKKFIVWATYAKGLQPCGYVVYADTLKEAKAHFKKVYTWLNIISKVEEAVE